MTNILTENEIAQYFGTRHMLGILRFPKNSGEILEASPYFSWYFWTDYFGTGRREYNVIWKPVFGIPLQHTCIAIIHTHIGSKAMIYYAELSDLNDDKSQPLYPYVVDIEPKKDKMIHHFNHFNLTYQENRERRIINLVKNRLVTFTPGMKSEILFNFYDQEGDDTLLKFRNSMLETYANVAQEYDDPRLTKIFNT